MTNELESSLKVTSHRGPDASGSYVKKVGNFFVGVGHNRLSIVDLSDKGSQPMSNDTGVTLSYNGEIYNHRTLRKGLEKKGYVFEGTSDTEVLLKLYEEFGSDSFGMLRGMFSFFILDEHLNKIFLVRDSVGIKPLYIYQDDEIFLGCSEIRGLKEYSGVNREIDPGDVFEFFNNGFLYEPSTGYKYIKKLSAGTFLEFDLQSGEKTLNEYELNNSDDCELLDEKLCSAINDQKNADVPLGVFFSGGADSSILAAFVGEADLFFAKYDSDPRSDIDMKYSKLIADFLSKELKIFDMKSEDDSVESILSSINFVASNTEELISDYTFWATYQLSVAARNSGYKVMLSGMGGDEVFAGYPRYLILKGHRLIKFLCPVLTLLLKYKLFPESYSKRFDRLVSYAQEEEWGVAYSRMLGYFSKEELNELFSCCSDFEFGFKNKLNDVLSGYKGSYSDKVKLAQHLDRKGFLSHNLMVSDKASMLASIELRVPFLDEGVVSHGLTLSSNSLIRNKKTKYPLKKILLSLLPSKLVERPKTGFNPPLDGVINKIGKNRLYKELHGLDSVLNFNKINKLIEGHFSGKENNTYKLWQLLYFKKWLVANEVDSIATLKSCA